MKFLRFKNPAYLADKSVPQYHLAIVIDIDGEEHYAAYVYSLNHVAAERSMRFKPVKGCPILPNEFKMNAQEFHETRRILEAYMVGEEVTEEQAKTEEAINIDSGFNWIKSEQEAESRDEKKSNGGRSTGSNGPSSKHAVGSAAQHASGQYFPQHSNYGYFPSPNHIEEKVFLDTLRDAAERRDTATLNHLIKHHCTDGSLHWSTNQQGKIVINRSKP